MENYKLSEMIKTTLENVKSIAEANTVVGDPITAPNGVVILPVSKVSVGYASGGLDFASKKEDKSKNFGGGGGTGVSMTPLAFLVIKPDGQVELLNMNQPDTAVNRIAGIGDLIEKSPEVISRIKSVFSKDETPED